MNKHTIALLVLLVLIGVGLYALADYQHGRALAPVSASAPAGGGLVVNGLSIGPSAFEEAAASEAAPAVPAAAGETCP